MTSIVDIEQGQFLDINGAATHYHDVGEGKVVLLLHGSGPGVSAWANWRHAIPALASSARVLALDLVGYGATERSDTVRYSLRTWTDHVWSFLDELGIDKVSVIGNSLGGRIAMQMAEDNQDRLDRLVLMGAPGVGMTLTEGLKALRSYEPSYEAMSSMLKTYFAVDKSIITDDLVQIRYQASAAPGAHEAYRLMFFHPDHAGSELVVSEDQVRAITVPTLLVHGREDRVVPVDVAWNMIDLLPNGDLHVFSRCGHWTQIEHADEFNRRVSDFLEIVEAH
ncbi:alpha/beta fold hydrolase [Rhodococcus erythropolis]|uniref:Alpha/beta hydrolase n=1 Tax=Rhodococcus erythropolis TaxID=1833 RepID=A0AAX3ZXQ7_RHOER|nr:alpha/beta hydrolase [Rhodococcus erythropolis]WMN01715.1 alpha/beta hydrolase [Rhodococcus erythropolis]